MRLSPTLSLYIARHFLLHFVILLLVFLGLILLLDTVELLRRASKHDDIPIGLVLHMSLLKLPQVGQITFPFAVLFAGMSAFWRLTRSHELVVTRAAGVSAWQFLFPVIIVSLMLGVFKIAVVNPLGSITLTAFETLESRHLEGQSNLLAISSNGLWLRQGNMDGQSVVHSKNVLQQGQNVELKDVTIFVYQGGERFSSRIESDYAYLEDGFWRLVNVDIHVPEKPVETLEEHWFETDLTIGKIQDSFAPPDTMSFWDLPDFIQTLEDAGFNAKRHRLHFHGLLAAPLLFCAMVLIAATFTLRQTRKGGTTAIVAGGVATGFLLYFFSDVVFALALSDSIPVELAAWAPAGVSTLLGIAMLFHLEDG